MFQTLGGTMLVTAREETIINRTAKISGIIVNYDACSRELKNTSDFYTPDKWGYIGDGSIFMINGVEQYSFGNEPKEILSFYVKKF